MVLPRFLRSHTHVYIHTHSCVQGRKACKAFWSKWVEPNAARLTKLLLAKPAGRYTLIRLCNKLAQRMSKTHDSSFCGQVTHACSLPV